MAPRVHDFMIWHACIHEKMIIVRYVFLDLLDCCRRLRDMHTEILKGYEI